MNKTEKHKIMITCATGIGETLAEEIKSLGFDTVAVRDTGVDIVGDFVDVMKLNLELRTAFCVMILLKEFRCTHPDQLYKQLLHIDWEEYIRKDGYVSVICRTNNPTIKNSMYANQKVKDAIVDRMLEQTGQRPDSGSSRDKIVVNVYWYGEICRVYLNTTGVKLSDRGYRKMPHSAPVQESLAAALLYKTSYKGDCPLICPMCGSGTFAIEAALIAQNRASGLLRSNFSFMHYSNFDAEIWQKMRAQTRKRAKTELKYPIIATDIDPAAINAAKKNAQTAGVDHLIEFDVCDFSETKIPQQGGVIILNPEYGERLGDVKKLETIYKQIGDFLKQKCSGYTGYIFTGNLELAKKIGLRASRRFVFYNASIECRLLKYELYKGSK